MWQQQQQQLLDASFTGEYLDKLLRCSSGGGGCDEGRRWSSGWSFTSAASTAHSPPTKWPRQLASSTATAHDSTLNTTADSGLGECSFASPPSRRSLPGSSSLLRTPTSLLHPANVHFSSSPSPLRAFQIEGRSRSSFRLSNPRNATGIRFCGEQRASSSRCLEMPPVEPSTSTAADASRGDSVLDRTLPYISGVPETPTKGLGDDEGLDDSLLSDFPLLPSSTPVKRLSLSLNPLGRVPECATGPMERCLAEHLPPPPASCAISPNPEERRENRAVATATVKREVEERPPDATPQQPPPQRVALRPTQTINIPKLAHSVHLDELAKAANKSQEAVSAVINARPRARRKPEREPEVFKSPSKPHKPYSRRWLRICTGSTRAQREATVWAHVHLASRRGC